MTIVAPATLGEQVAPRILLVLLGSALLGTIAGLGLAMSRERSEDMFRSVGEIRQTLGVPVIGRIPVLAATSVAQSDEFPGFDPLIVTLHDELTPAAEAFRSVRTSLFFSTVGQTHRVIQITSPLPGDGKSTVTANLAVAIASSGKRVLVLDADFRRPALTHMLGEPETDQIGLAGIIAGKTSLASSVVKTQVENLYFLPVCERPTQPSELLSTPEFKQLIDEAREKYDLVLIDTPPVIPVTDPCVVAARVDGVILTLRIRRGVQEAALRAMESLRNIDANVLGIIVNAWQSQNPGERGEYGYGYGYDGYDGLSRSRQGKDSGGLGVGDTANGKESHWLGQLMSRR
jgi:capsular exopolysaccharide synthesis family protein